MGILTGVNQRGVLWLSTLAHWFHVLFATDNRLHQARFSRLDELGALLSPTLPADGLLLGTRKAGFVCMRRTQRRRELGNLMVVAPTRGGKGLLAISQLLTWQHAVVVNDPKGELFQATGGYRASLGPVFVLDPVGGVGHCFDPLHRKQTEDEFYSAATHLLFEAEERERIFTQRATGMLTQLFLAARREQIAPFPYVRFLIRLGLEDAAARLNAVDPLLATQFLDRNFASVNWSDKFLLSSWSTLTTRMRPILTETVIRTLTRADFTPEELMRGRKPVSVYLRWREQDLLSLAPLVRLLWGSLIYELISVYDTAQGKDCQPVLLLIDEASKTAIPSLSEHAATVAGRGIILSLFLQDLSQLETIYTKARSQTLRANMDTQLYYPPRDLATAQYLEESLGARSGFAHSTTSKEGTQTGEGLSERPIPLLTAQEIRQQPDGEVLGFHRHLPPIRMQRLDWREHSVLRRRQALPAPQLLPVPQLSEITLQRSALHPEALIDPDLLSGDEGQEADNRS